MKILVTILILMMSASYGNAASSLDDLLGNANNNKTKVYAELVLAVDVSGSVDNDELEFQRQGYVTALEHFDIINTIKFRKGGIAIYYFEWNDQVIQRIDWHVVHDLESMKIFTQKIKDLDNPVRGGKTSVSSAVMEAKDMIDGNDYSSQKQVIDISADGINNTGPNTMQHAREYALEGGRTTINGLIISIKSSVNNVESYFEECVIGGPSHFIETVNSIDEFPEKIRKKLVQEIGFQWKFPSFITTAHASPPAYIAQDNKNVGFRACDYKHLYSTNEGRWRDGSDHPSASDMSPY